MLAGLGLLAVEFSAAGGDPCGETDALCPDLETVSPGDDWLELRRTGKNGQRLLLRLSNKIGNRGAGPLEMREAATTPQECIDQSPDPNPDFNRGVVQRIYEDTADADSVGWFDRVDEGGSYTDYPVGCYFFHDVHNHWHFQDFSEYTLERLDGSELGESTKVGFCVLDQDQPFDPDPVGTPQHGHYPTGGGCNNPDDPVGSQGLSIGYADIYTYFTPGQTIDITGIRRGKYCLVSTANPLPRLYESDASDLSNERRVKIQIKPRENLVRERPLPC